LPGAVPYAPNAVIVGFLATTVGSIIGMLVFPMFGLAMILPGLLTNFLPAVRRASSVTRWAAAAGR
jgi:ascorbate-specific PTS system EIIC-type component UlaA